MCKSLAPDGSIRIQSLLWIFASVTTNASIVDFAHHKLSQRQGDSQLLLIGIFVLLSQDGLCLYSLNDISTEVKEICGLLINVKKLYKPGNNIPVVTRRYTQDQQMNESIEDRWDSDPEIDPF
jgi:hypothetical protein